MTTFFSNIRGVLAFIVIVLSFLFLFSLLYVKIPEENQTVVNVAAGIILGITGSVAAYYWGSSKNESDKAKTEQQNLQTPPPEQLITTTNTTEVKLP